LCDPSPMWAKGVNRVDCVRRASDILLNVQSENADRREIGVP
jgi:hypothetical protein